MSKFEEPYGILRILLKEVNFSKELKVLLYELYPPLCF